jgi:hypothetical protein
MSLSEEKRLALDNRWTVVLSGIVGSAWMGFTLLVLKIVSVEGVALGIVGGLVLANAITVYRIKQTERINRLIDWATNRGIELERNNNSVLKEKSK